MILVFFFFPLMLEKSGFQNSLGVVNKEELCYVYLENLTPRSQHFH